LRINVLPMVPLLLPWLQLSNHWWSIHGLWRGGRAWRWKHVWRGGGWATSTWLSTIIQLQCVFITLASTWWWSYYKAEE
jgi:hypothetical protein